jgi:alpha-tubulin suppressor-like RCC1 family protein
MKSFQPFGLALFVLFAGCFLSRPTVTASQLMGIHETGTAFLLPLREIAQIKAGGIHTCGSSVDGTVRCWGYNEQGQVGSGAASASSLPVSVTGLIEEVQFLAPGMFHTCAANSDTVYCWGLDDHGQLGNGDNGESLVPVKVMGLHDGVQEIDSGHAHTCVRATPGEVQCWGMNQHGELGDGTTTDRLTPVSVGGLSGGTLAISSGEFHTCALLDTGDVWCWGSNSFGQLGDGTRESRSSPVAVSGLNAPAVAITAAGFHTCVLLETGAMQCWGSNGAGQLGDGTTVSRLTPTIVRTSAQQIQAITSGASHTCALMTAGNIACWGDNRWGQLGDGTTENRSLPTPVLGIGEPLFGITGGDNFTCGTTQSGGVKCWGSNYVGQLGDHTLVDRLMPVDVLIEMELERTLFLPVISR